MFAITHAPGGSIPHTPIPHADKAYHFALFFLLAWLGGRWHLQRNQQLSVGALVLWALVYSVYAAVDEWTQPLVGRSCGWMDWVSDVAGVAAATVLLTRGLPRSSAGTGDSLPATGHVTED